MRGSVLSSPCHNHLIDLKKAKKYIHMEYFIWRDDVLTNRIKDILIDRSSAEFGRVVQALKDMIPPVVSRTGTEYALRLANGSACIFRVNIDEKPRLIEGSINFFGE